MASTSWSQASEAEMRAFPMPPAQGYARQKHLAFRGDYGNYLWPYLSYPNLNIDPPADYVYVRYTGISGKKIHVESVWGITGIPPSSQDGDNCGHAHNSYGVWVKYEIPSKTGWLFLGGGGMSGARDASGSCVFSTKNNLTTIDPRFGWGHEFLIFDFTGGTMYTELVVGALSNTHGWGSCGAFACHEPSYVMLYTWP